MKTKFFTARRITGIALLSALAVVLLFIPFLRGPILPAAPFLEYDACDIPIMFATFAYGPISGLIVTIVVSLIQGFTVSAQSGWYGIIMHILASGTFTLTAGFLFAFLKTKKLKRIASLAISTVVGAVCWVVIMVFANMAITPLFIASNSFEDVMKMMLPVIIPFNLIKATINGVIGVVLYIPLHKSVERYLDKQVVTNEDIIKAELAEFCENNDELNQDIMPKKVEYTDEKLQKNLKIIEDGDYLPEEIINKKNSNNE